jgi:hypothetical protein
MTARQCTDNAVNERIAHHIARRWVLTDEVRRFFAGEDADTLVCRVRVSRVVTSNR